MRVDLSLLRDAAWLGSDRARAYRAVLLVLLAVVVLGTIATSHRGLDVMGRPIGTDFISFWAAAGLAAAGDPAAAYDVGAHWAAQKAAFPGEALDYTAFFYPPVFLLLCLPLGFLPYFGALALWLGTTGALCAAALRRLAAGQWLTVLAFPAVWQNLMHGQNGFLTAALFAAGLGWSRSCPLWAGAALGCLICKPHLLLLVPVALIAGRRWATLAATAITAALLGLASLAVLGAGTWQAFIAGSALARATLEQNLVGNDKMQSVFAAVRLLGGGLGLAYAAQALLACGVAACVAWVWRRGADDRGTAWGHGALLATGALLVSPFLLSYDMVLLAVPLLWLLREGEAGGFRPWEKIVMAAAFMAPLVTVVLAHFLRVPLAPWVVLALFVVVARRLVAGEAGLSR